MDKLNMAYDFSVYSGYLASIWKPERKGSGEVLNDVSVQNIL